MSEIKKLAGQTLWYGIPTIANRFLGYLLNLALPFFFHNPADTADLTQIYALIPFLNILFTYGLETAYFRFAQTDNKEKLYNTLTLSLFTSTLLFTLLLLLLKNMLVQVTQVQASPQYINWMIAILFFDAISTLAFARLRLENRPRKFALVRLSGIIVTLVIVLLFVGVFPNWLQKHPHSFLSRLYPSGHSSIEYYLIGNFIGSLVTFLLLLPEYRSLKLKFSIPLWKKVMTYAYPLIIVGLGGMINDMLSRLIYQHVVDLPPEEAKFELGIFGNIYRIAVLITIATQAFRMAAEPFFFNKSTDADAPRTYARVMKFFVITCCFMFLGIGLYIDCIQWFFEAIKRSQWVEGLYIVPLLALGNIFLGIYYNLSIWYKLTNNNMKGAVITITGAVITIVLNIILIPQLHYLGAAIATFCCYLYMMLASYIIGKKYYPVPYATRKLTAYLIICMMLYGLHRLVVYLYPPWWFNLITGTLLLLAFTWLIVNVERKELQKIPFIKNFV